MKGEIKKSSGENWKCNGVIQMWMLTGLAVNMEYYAVLCSMQYKSWFDKLTNMGEELQDGD